MQNPVGAEADGPECGYGHHQGEGDGLPMPGADGMGVHRVPVQIYRANFTCFHLVPFVVFIPTLAQGLTFPIDFESALAEIN